MLRMIAKASLDGLLSPWEWTVINPRCGKGGQCYKVTWSTKGKATSHIDADSFQYEREQHGGKLILKVLVEERICRQAWWTEVISHEAGARPRKAQKWGLAAIQGITGFRDHRVLHPIFFFQEETKIQILWWNFHNELGNKTRTRTQGPRLHCNFAISPRLINDAAGGNSALLE